MVVEGLRVLHVGSRYTACWQPLYRDFLCEFVLPEAISSVSGSGAYRSAGRSARRCGKPIVVHRFDFMYAESIAERQPHACPLENESEYEDVVSNQRPAAWGNADADSAGCSCAGYTVYAPVIGWEERPAIKCVNSARTS